MERVTVRELSQLRYLKREITVERERLAALRERLGPAAISLDGTPRAPNPRDAVSGMACELAYFEQLIAQNMKRAVCELLRLQKFINEIPDSDTRQIFYYRYVKGKSWSAIAFLLEFGDEATARKRHDAYLHAGISRTRYERTKPSDGREVRKRTFHTKAENAAAESGAQLNWRPNA